MRVDSTKDSGKVPVMRKLRVTSLVQRDRPSGFKRQNLVSKGSGMIEATTGDDRLGTNRIRRPGNGVIPKQFACGSFKGV